MASIGTVGTIGSYRGYESPKSGFQRLEDKTKERHIEYDNQVTSRYGNILCVKKGAVKTECWTGNSPHEVTIHANTMGEGVSERKLIGAQYPASIPHPFEEGEKWAGFWNAAFHHDVTIVDLTNDQDGMRPYYPTHGQTVTDRDGTTRVTHKSEENPTSTYDVRIKQGREWNPQTKSIRRYNYPNWPDRGVVTLPQLHELVNQVERLHSNPEDYLFIHCRGGVGRTGVLVAALIIKERIKNGFMTKENLEEQVIDLIVHLRTQRNEHIVGNENQFNFLVAYAKSFF